MLHLLLLWCQWTNFEIQLFIAKETLDTSSRQTSEFFSTLLFKLTPIRAEQVISGTKSFWLNIYIYRWTVLEVQFFSPNFQVRYLREIYMHFFVKSFESFIYPCSYSCTTLRLKLWVWKKLRSDRRVTLKKKDYEFALFTFFWDFLFLLRFWQQYCLRD